MRAAREGGCQLTGGQWTDGMRQLGLLRSRHLAAAAERLRQIEELREAVLEIHHLQRGKNEQRTPMSTPTISSFIRHALPDLLVPEGVPLDLDCGHHVGEDLRERREDHRGALEVQEASAAARAAGT